ncbi:MAG: FliI/YscN family ATPase [Sporichthyaceae bacterium]
MRAALQVLSPALLAAAAPRRTGTVTGVLGLVIDVVGLPAAVAELVIVETDAGPIPAEVVAVYDQRGHSRLSCMPLGRTTGIRAGLAVRGTGCELTIGIGPELRGRVLDGLGHPIDGGPSLAHLPQVGVDGRAPHPLNRGRVCEPLSVGVRALDTLVPLGRGQRIGIFAGSGVGKSSLLSMITRGTEAAVSVICLVGERGREVREFLENDLGPEGLARSVVVVATSDEPPMVRLRAPFVATRIAEYLRDQGLDVVLLMDSLTRLAYAQREVGLSAGEPPATRGYPPSVFALLPRLLERAGPGEVGSITGVYTVLVEGDDHNEPIGDTARSILDGHITLTRALATAGHFPSIDVLDSVSRVTGAITTPAQRAAAGELRRLLAAYRDARELIEIGAYVPGTNPLVDRAQALAGPIEAFLRQDLDEVSDAASAWAGLGALLGLDLGGES